MTIRVAKALEQEAASAAKLARRSLGKQIEYWASVGQTVCSQLNEAEIFRLLEGQVNLKNTGVDFRNDLDADDLVNQLEQQRMTGALAQSTSNAKVKIQRDPDHPGMLQMVHLDGSIERGVWENDHFVTKEKIRTTRG